MKNNKTLMAMALILFGLIVGTASVELLARLFLGSPSSAAMKELNRAFAFFSPSAFIQDECGAVRYTPNRWIRAIAVFDGRVEWDVRFQTNNFGSIDSQDYVANYKAPSSIKRIAFVGDSFTAGFHGGKPWLQRLREQFDGDVLQIYNLGVSGTGLAHFFTRLKCESQTLYFDHIVISALTTDFWRGEWRPVETSTKLFFCRRELSEEECRQSPTRLRVLPREDVSLAELQRLASDLGGHVTQQPVSFRTLLRQHTHVGKLLHSVKQMVLSEQTVPEDSHSILQKISQTFADRKIVFLHLPSKSEVKNKAYSRDLEALITNAGIQYWPALHRCPITLDGFFEHDGHPNANGYSQIEACARKMLAGFL